MGCTDKENGEDVLACSPFHVRFGKLRVLRAGEKRVTLSLPNNLPEPHIAPFSMKVGDQGEAFFVLETEDEVPLDLMTSPVITAEDVSESNYDFLTVGRPSPTVTGRSSATERGWRRPQRITHPAAIRGNGAPGQPCWAQPRAIKLECSARGRAAGFECH